MNERAKCLQCGGLGYIKKSVIGRSVFPGFLGGKPKSSVHRVPCPRCNSRN